MASRRQGLRAVDDPAESAAKAAKPSAPATPTPARAAKSRKGDREKRITIYAEATEDDRRALTITAALLGTEKGDVVRALMRAFTSESPSSRQLEQLREIIAKHA